MNKNIDFKLLDNLDVSLDGVQENQETTLLTALFTDKEVNGRRGYWIDLIMSDLWTYDQGRSDQDTINEIQQSVNETMRKVMDEAILHSITAEVHRENGIMTLDISAKDDKEVVINRRFAI